MECRTNTNRIPGFATDERHGWSTPGSRLFPVTHGSHLVTHGSVIVQRLLEGSYQPGPVSHTPVRDLRIGVNTPIGAGTRPVHGDEAAGCPGGHSGFRIPAPRHHPNHTMKLALAIIALDYIFLCRMRQKAAVNAANEAKKDSLDKQKDAVDSAAKAAQKPAAWSDVAKEAEIEARKDTVKAQLDAEKAKSNAPTPARKRQRLMPSGNSPPFWGERPINPGTRNGLQATL